MKLASFSAKDGSSYGIVTAQGIIDLGRALGEEYPDLRSLLAGDALRSTQNLLTSKSDYRLEDVAWLPVIPNPDKIICVGLNYEEHRIETGQEKTPHPALFLRVSESQTGHKQPILRPRESATLDYEAEIAIVIGKAGRRISAEDAWSHIAGFSCYNDGSVREFQRHTMQYTAGKNFVATGGFGPWMVTADEIPLGTELTLSCRVNGELRQHTSSNDMIFQIPELIVYASTFTTLKPGDVIVTGTPSGCGARRTPQIWLKPGDVIEVEIDKIGILENSIKDD